MYIKVKVKPSSKKEFMEKISTDTFNICVKEPAERNLANKKIISIIASEFMIPLGKVRIVNGHHSKSKILNVDIE